MAKKICLCCGEELGILDGKVKIADGHVCVDCWTNAGFSRDANTLMTGPQYTGTDIQTAVFTLQQNEIEMQNFHSTKKLSPVLFDDFSKRFAIKAGKSGEIIRYDQIVDFELLEDGESITKGGVGQALLGGAIFGGVGAIVGGVTGTKRTKNVCNSLQIKITVRNYYKPSIYISLIKSSTKTESFLYKRSYQDAQDILSALQLAVDKVNSKVEQAASAPQVISAADEIKKFKALCDDGIITAEEFEWKKKELLGF